MTHDILKDLLCREKIMFYQDSTILLISPTFSCSRIKLSSFQSESFHKC